MSFASVLARLGVHVPDLDLGGSGSEDTLCGGMPSDMTGFPRVGVESRNGFEILGRLLSRGVGFVSPGVEEDLLVDAGDRYSAVLAGGSDEGIVKGGEGGVEDGSGVGAAERVLVRVLPRLAQRTDEKRSSSARLVVYGDVLVRDRDEVRVPRRCCHATHRSNQRPNPRHTDRARSDFENRTERTHQRS